jgi:putative endonuclease
MTHFCYIIFSEKLNKFYIGETSDFSNRLQMHNIGFSSFTSKANDWVVHLVIECHSKYQASKIEQHIKAMKNRTYIENLARYSEIISKLKDKYT